MGARAENRRLRAELADIREQLSDARRETEGVRYDLRRVAGQWSELHDRHGRVVNALHEQRTHTHQLAAKLTRSEQGRRNLIGLLNHHRDLGSLGILRQTRSRLDRALRACARYRAEIAGLAALEPAAWQTCRSCGAGYALGEPCTTCAYLARVAEVTA